MNYNQKLNLGGGSFEMPIQESWQVTYFENDSSKAEIRFNTGKYPVLGVNISSFDDPKVNLKSNLEKYLVGDSLNKETPGIKIKKDLTGICSIEYEASLDTGEKARVYRKAKTIGIRTVRVATLAFSWVKSKESEIVVKDIITEIDKSVDKIFFPKEKSSLDEEANITNRLKIIRFKNLELWKGFSFNMPASWKYEINVKDKNVAARVIGYDDAMLFIEGENLSLPEDFSNSSEYMKNLSASLKSDNNLQSVILQSGSENTYLVSCFKKQHDKEENINLEHYFWHYFVYKDKFFEKLSFTYVFPENRDKFLYHLATILDKSIKSLKIKNNL